MENQNNNIGEEFVKREPNNISNEEVVVHSISTNSNIIALSFDDCDEYNSISFKLGKPLRSPILLSTLLNSSNVLGSKKYRKITVKNPNEILDYIVKFYLTNTEKERVFKKNYPKTVLLDTIQTLIDKVNKENSNLEFDFKKFILNSNKEEIRVLVNDIASLYESSNNAFDEILSTLVKEFFIRNEEYTIMFINNSLYLIVLNNTPMSGYLCTDEGLMVFLNK